MSNFLYNSYRFSGANTARVDASRKNRGQITSDGRFGFDCSGFVWYTLKNSGLNIGDPITLQGRPTNQLKAEANEANRKTEG